MRIVSNLVHSGWRCWRSWGSFDRASVTIFQGQKESWSFSIYRSGEGQEILGASTTASARNCIGLGSPPTGCQLFVALWIHGLGRVCWKGMFGVLNRTHAELVLSQHPRPIKLLPPLPEPINPPIVASLPASLPFDDIRCNV